MKNDMENSSQNDVELDEKPLFLKVKEVFPNLEKHMPGLSPLVYEYARFLGKEILGSCNDKNFYLRCLESVKIFYRESKKRTHIGTLTKNIKGEQTKLMVEMASVLSKMGDEIEGVSFESDDKSARKRIKENLEN